MCVGGGGMVDPQSRVRERKMAGCDIIQSTSNCSTGENYSDKITINLEIFMRYIFSTITFATAVGGQ